MVVPWHGVEVWTMAIEYRSGLGSTALGMPRTAIPIIIRTQADLTQLQVLLPGLHNSID